MTLVWIFTKPQNFLPAVAHAIQITGVNQMKKQANKSKQSFKPTPIPHRTKFGEPMAYCTLSDDGKIHTEASRAVCLARIEEPNNPFPHRWFVDEESGLVVCLPNKLMSWRTSNRSGLVRQRLSRVLSRTLRTARSLSPSLMKSCGSP